MSQYFKVLARELDSVQSTMNFENLYDGYANMHRTDQIPYLFANAITDISKWDLPSAESPISNGFVRKYFEWQQHGLVFNSRREECCEYAETRLAETVRQLQEKPMNGRWDVVHHKRNYPAVIFTENNIAVGIRKSFGAATIYGLRDAYARGIGAKMLSTQDFENERFNETGKDVIVHELGDGEKFLPLRPAITAFDFTARLMTMRLGTRLMKRRALLLRHTAMVAQADRIVAENMTNSKARVA